MPNSIPNDINNGLIEFKENLLKEYGNNVEKVIVFGSYARGDFDDESDIDVAVIFKNADDEFIRKTRRYTARASTDFIFKYNKHLSPIKFDKNSFEKRSEYVPFYMNIKREGVEV